MSIDVSIKANLIDSKHFFDQKKYNFWILQLTEFIKDWVRSNDCNGRRSVTVQINSPCIISSFDILELIKSSVKNPSVIFSPINYDGSETPLIEVFIEKESSRKSVHPSAIAFPFSVEAQSNSRVETVNVIMRFHKSNAFEKLERSVVSLYSHTNCKIILHLLCQDLSEETQQKILELKKFLTIHDFFELCPKFYNSPVNFKDLRAFLLNQVSHLNIKGYCAFLDYDDLLFSDSYSKLILSMKNTGKKIGVGRIYSTCINEKGIVRKKINRWDRINDFFKLLTEGNIPLHSYLFRTELVENRFFDFKFGMIYMEDYVFNLQLFTADNSDWSLVREGVYIGDYIQSDANTLSSSIDKIVKVGVSQQFCSDAKFFNEVKWKKIVSTNQENYFEFLIFRIKRKILKIIRKYS